VPSKFLITLTQVRPLSPNAQIRDERSDPELILESVVADECAAALALFKSLCGLRSVRGGEHRPKVIPMPGLDTSADPAVWRAPLLTRAGVRTAGA
jgi:hypothetical protein